MGVFVNVSEDHYLRIFTDQGEELILMRLSDALLELELAKGMQTHRSWWVAHAAIADMRRTQGKLTLLLKSGLTVPVSRSFDKAVKDTCLPN
jgi:DNA-binding LytR/AlgR family response regulator